MEPIIPWFGLQLAASLAGSQVVVGTGSELDGPRDRWRESFAPLQVGHSTDTVTSVHHLTVGAMMTPWVGGERWRLGTPVGVEGFSWRSHAVVLHWWQDVYTDTIRVDFVGVRPGAALSRRMGSRAWLGARAHRVGWEESLTEWGGEVDAIGGVHNTVVRELPLSGGKGVLAAVDFGLEGTLVDGDGRLGLARRVDLSLEITALDDGQRAVGVRMAGALGVVRSGDVRDLEAD